MPTTRVLESFTTILESFTTILLLFNYLIRELESFTTLLMHTIGKFYDYLKLSCFFILHFLFPL